MVSAGTAQHHRLVSFVSSRVSCLLSMGDAPNDHPAQMTIERYRREFCFSYFSSELEIIVREQFPGRGSAVECSGHMGSHDAAYGRAPISRSAQCVDPVTLTPQIAKTGSVEERLHPNGTSIYRAVAYVINAQVERKIWLLLSDIAR